MNLPRDQDVVVPFANGFAHTTRSAGNSPLRGRSDRRRAVLYIPTGVGEALVGSAAVPVLLLRFGDAAAVSGGRHKSPGSGHRRGRNPGTCAVGPGHVAFRIWASEIEPWRARLAAVGVALETEIVWPQGGHSLYFRDPSGNSLELATPQLWGFAETASEK